MNSVKQLQILQSATDNPALLALVMVDIVHHDLPQTERSRIKEALLAAAVPHWCDSGFLAALLETTTEESERLFSHLRALTIVESFPTRGESAVNVREDTRHVLREYLRTTDTTRWKTLSNRAFAYVNSDKEENSRIEALVHLSATDQHAATTTSDSLTQEFMNTENSEAPQALALAVAELVGTEWFSEGAEVVLRRSPREHHESHVELYQPELLAAANAGIAASFRPPLPLRNAHLMTLVPRYTPRDTSLAGVHEESRFFTVEPDARLLGYCHWQDNRQSSPTVILVHGLEGSSESRYMRGIAAKAYRVGFNVIRMNQRTCGGTEHCSLTLYNSGLSGDYRAIIRELVHRDGLDRIWLVGYSMGGNLMLKAAGELARTEPALAGVAAVCPNINPTLCAHALEEPRNQIYHRHFLTRLKWRLRRKAALLPGKWDLSALDQITTISEFDDRYTAPDGGYRDGADYYYRAGARHVLHAIAVPTLIITAQDDPFIPYSMFTAPQIQQHPHIRLVAPRYGGHCGFFQSSQKWEDPYWAENRIVDFLQGRL